VVDERRVIDLQRHLRAGYGDRDEHENEDGHDVTDVTDESHGETS
jgi:hypothetical protein